MANSSGVGTISNSRLEPAVEKMIVDENTNNLRNLLLQVLTKASMRVDTKKCSEDEQQAFQSLREVWDGFQESLKFPSDHSKKEMIGIRHENVIAQCEAFGWCDEGESELLRVYISMYTS